jgi:perosamine synthetase
MISDRTRPVAPLLVAEGATLIEAIRVIDEGGYGICLVTEADGRLIGVLTDRDTRRATLGGAGPGTPIAPFVMREPVTVAADAEDEEIFALMQASGKHQIPVVDGERRVLDLRIIGDFVGTIPLAIPNLGGNEWDYVKQCLDTNFVSSVGPFVERFESRVADFVGARHAVACISGTAALHVACLVCGVGPGDEVLMPALTFIAPANAVSYCGARPVFLDSARDSLGLDPAALEAFLQRNAERSADGILRNRRTGARIAASIVVHIFGHPADMDALNDICGRYGLPLIEDAAESLGSTYHGRQTGALSTVGALSFNGNKIVTTGGGGMVVTNDAQIARRAHHLTTQAKSDPLRYEHDEIGYNYRLSNILAAIGMAQMEKIGAHFERKRAIAHHYARLLEGVSGCHLFQEQPWAQSNYWLNFLMVPPERKKPLLAHLIEAGIMARPVWGLINRQPMYRTCEAGPLPVADDLYAGGISLPASVMLSNGEIEHVCAIIRQFMRKAA